MRSLPHEASTSSEAHPTLSTLDQMEAELKTIFDRDIDLITRQGIETIRNYLRRQEISPLLR
jgi:uncharacterized protein